MKKKNALLFLFGFILIALPHGSTAQILKKIKNEVTTRAERKTVTKAGNATDKAIDKVLGGGKKTNTTSENSSSEETSNNTTQAVSQNSYKNYDFVPGARIIFQPDLSTEPDAELPARFIIHSGNAEIQTYQGEKILHLNADGNASVSPLMSNENYLPDQFTVEFDMMYENDASYFKYVNNFQVQFRGADDAGFKAMPLFRFVIESNSKCLFGSESNRQYFPEDLNKSMNTGNVWHHIAIYVNKNIGKVYIDGHRVAASNTLPVGAKKFNIASDRYGIKIKNVRVAAGGEDKYKKVITDGKFITYGILFDVNKSAIKPESMGTLNEIAKMMKEHNDLRFQINGHTDSDGNADDNMKLSQQRADAVKAKLVELGIDASRLTTKGWGAMQPIDKNDSAEGKARNRRVEFIRL